MSKSSLATISVPAYTGNYTKGRDGRKIEMISIHHMAGVLTVEQCGNIFKQVGRNGSSNYGIGNDGKIGNYVDESNTAWTNGNWDANCKSVTIETSNCENGGNWKVSDKALNSLIKLVADIGKRNNLGTLVKGKNVVWHSMFASTSCPGPYLLSKMDYIVSEANKLNNATTSSTNKSIDELAREVIAGKFGNGEQRKKALGNLYNEVQKRVNEILSGKVSTPKKSIDEVAKLVLQGYYGNQPNRQKKLEAEGYNYKEVQARVNQLLK